MNWNEYFYYDETSPTCLRWAISPSKRLKAGSPAGSRQYRPGNKIKRAIQVGVVNNRVCVNRVIWELFNGPIPEGMVIDHLNGDPWDNRIINLECKTQSQNQHNRGYNRNNSTGIPGICFCNEDTFVRASIRYNKRRYSKNFSFNKYGKELAIKLAIEWRNNIIKLLNERDGMYTERHRIGE